MLRIGFTLATELSEGCLGKSYVAFLVKTVAVVPLTAQRVDAALRRDLGGFHERPISFYASVNIIQGVEILIQ